MRRLGLWMSGKGHTPEAWRADGRKAYARSGARDPARSDQYVGIGWRHCFSPAVLPIDAPRSGAGHYASKRCLWWATEFPLADPQASDNLLSCLRGLGRAAPLQVPLASRQPGRSGGGRPPFDAALDGGICCRSLILDPRVPGTPCGLTLEGERMARQGGEPRDCSGSAPARSRPGRSIWTRAGLVEWVSRSRVAQRVRSPREPAEVPPRRPNGSA